MASSQASQPRRVTVDQDVEALLNKFGLSEYAGEFAAQGFITLQDMSLLTDEAQIQKFFGITQARPRLAIAQWAVEYKAGIVHIY
jgi:hypothetical protein